MSWFVFFLLICRMRNNYHLLVLFFYCIHVAFLDCVPSIRTTASFNPVFIIEILTHLLLEKERNKYYNKVVKDHFPGVIIFTNCQQLVSYSYCCWIMLLCSYLSTSLCTCMYKSMNRCKYKLWQLSDLACFFHRQSPKYTVLWVCDLHFVE